MGQQGAGMVSSPPNAQGNGACVPSPSRSLTMYKGKAAKQLKVQGGRWKFATLHLSRFLGKGNVKNSLGF